MGRRVDEGEVGVEGSAVVGGVYGAKSEVGGVAV